MARYNFTDLMANPLPGEQALRTIIDGVDLDKTIPGFRTASVTGREVLTPSLLVTERVGGDGAWVDNVRIPPRSLIVSAVIDYYQDRSAELNRRLQGKALTIGFSDDPSTSYTAYLQSVSAPKNNRHHQAVDFVFLCPDPYAYGAPKTSTGAISTSTGYPVKLSSITATFTASSTGDARISTPSHAIHIKGPIASGDVIVVRWDDDPSTSILTVNGTPSAERMLISSDYAHVTPTDGQTLTASPSATLSVVYRERRL